MAAWPLAAKTGRCASGGCNRTFHRFLLVAPPRLGMSASLAPLMMYLPARSGLLGRVVFLNRQSKAPGHRFSCGLDGRRHAQIILMERGSVLYLDVADRKSTRLNSS